jgi:hypothetical protein
MYLRCWHASWPACTIGHLVPYSAAMNRIPIPVMVHLAVLANFITGMHNRAFGPYSEAMNWVLIPVMVHLAVLAYFIAGMSPNMDVANAALPAYVVTLLFFGGFLLRWDDIPNYWKWCGALRMRILLMAGE